MIRGRVEHDHGDGFELVVAFEHPEHFDAVHHGHAHIEQQQVGHGAFDGVETGEAIGRLVDDAVEAGEGLFHEDAHGFGIIDGEILQQDPVLSRAVGFNFPLRITGTLDEPSVLPDFSGLAGMLGQAVRQRASEEVDEAREEAEEEAQLEIDEARDELEDSLRDRLRDRLD
jgi:hypothetical protein